MRTAATWAIGAAWTVVIATVAVIATVLTLGRVRSRLAAALGPVWAAPILWAAGVRIRCEGVEHLDQPGSFVLVLNHSSSLDTMAVASLAPPGLAPLMKAELKWVPFVGAAFWAIGSRFVDRGDHAQALRSVARLADAMRRERLVAVIAPEGTRSRTGELQPFKSGAFHLAKDLGIPVVPMVVHGAWALMPAGGWRVRPGEVVVRVHPPVTVDDPHAAAAALHDAYAGWLAAEVGAS